MSIKHLEYTSSSAIRFALELKGWESFDLNDVV